jgi:ribosome-associated protein
MPIISRSLVIHIRAEEVEITAVRAQGAGGQNVNKVSNAVHLRFDIPASSLPNAIKERLLLKRGSRITSEGVIVIKAQCFRSLDQNRDDALARLQDIVDSATVTRPPRKATRPTKGSQRRRVNEKVRRGKIKGTRRRLDDE